MAGVTAHDRRAAEGIPVDRIRHRHHASRDRLHRLVVAIPHVDDVTVLALHTKRAAHQMHRLVHLRRRQFFVDLDVLELLRRRAHRLRRLRRGARGIGTIAADDAESQHEHQDHTLAACTHVRSPRPTQPVGWRQSSSRNR
jgi:hypothetical protein